MRALEAWILALAISIHAQILALLTNISCVMNFLFVVEKHL